MQCVCVCVCVCVSMCVCVCINVCVCVCVFVCVCIHTYVRTYIHTCICRAAVCRGRASGGEQREAESARQAHHQGAACACLCACVWGLRQLISHVCMCTFIYYLYICCICAAVRKQCNRNVVRLYAHIYICIYIYISSELLDILDSFFFWYRPRPRDTVCSFSRR